MPYLGRNFISNVPPSAISLDGITWRQFCERQNEALYTIGPPAQGGMAGSSCESLEVTDNPGERRRQADLAFDLLSHLLQPEVGKRWTAREVLQHEWLREGEWCDDDVHFPHAPGKGVCADFHFQDTTTGADMVHVGQTVRMLIAGEGIAVGNEPCEFHKDVCS
jgi:cell division control protein 7